MPILGPCLFPKNTKCKSLLFKVLIRCAALYDNMDTLFYAPCVQSNKLFFFPWDVKSVVRIPVCVRSGLNFSVSMPEFTTTLPFGDTSALLRSCFIPYD